ncbi:hypothetical protein SESBI_40180 [Sesbania bispinosa]|nr:hypothetical protein SESBI_40180 [Sesbania bispinosa]
MACLDAERVALLKLKVAFNHPNGSALPSWHPLVTAAHGRVSYATTPPSESHIFFSIIRGPMNSAICNGP